MNIFISGGCKNGKSYYAQELAREQSQNRNVPLYYLATMIPVDKEDENRILRHIDDRAGWGFETLEQGRNICKALDRADPQGSFLLDSVTALLSNEMFLPDGTVYPDCGTTVAQELVEFGKKTGNTIFVSDFMYSDAILYDEMTENYRKSLAYIDKILAKFCDQVIEVAFGNQYTYY